MLAETGRHFARKNLDIKSAYVGRTLLKLRFVIFVGEERRVHNIEEYLSTGCNPCRRPLTIAHCSKTSDFVWGWEQLLPFLVLKFVIWQASRLHFGILGDPGTILRHLVTPGRTPWGPGFDLFQLWMDFG